MIVIINASIVRVGGGLQVTHSFINECMELSDYTFHILLSQKLTEMVDRSLFPPNFIFHDIRSVPSSIRGRRRLRRELSGLERRIRPDIVFTVFGPPYWRPKAKHICGFAKGQYIYKDSPFFRMLSFKEVLLLKLKEFFHIKSFRNDCDVLVVETDDVRTRVMKILPRKPAYTVTNTCHQIFDKSREWSHDITIPKSDGFTLLTISANYSHKNLRIIPKVIDYLVERYPGFKFRFVLTIDRNQLQDITFQHDPYLVLLGKVSLSSCPGLYQQADAMFLPTLLECFSVSYLEAMKMNRVILTSELSFATGICKDAALYFDPLSPESIGDTIYKAATSDTLRAELLKKGQQRLTDFLSAKERAGRYLSIIKESYETANTIL